MENNKDLVSKIREAIMDMYQRKRPLFAKAITGVVSGGTSNCTDSATTLNTERPPTSFLIYRRIPGITLPESMTEAIPLFTSMASR